MERERISRLAVVLNILYELEAILDTFNSAPTKFYNYTYLTETDVT